MSSTNAGGGRRRPGASVLHVRLSPRERRVVELVGAFGQLTSGQIGELAFDGLASQTPLKRTLKRLYERELLSRLEMRLVGGSGGASAQYVYQLGREGWRELQRPGRYMAREAVDYHTRDVADCYIRLVRGHRTGVFTLAEFVTEPVCWRHVGNIHLMPDAYARLEWPSQGNWAGWWLEVERSRKNNQRIREKVRRYWQAFQRWQEPVFPLVVFVAPDESRAQEVNAIVHQAPPEAGGLFKTTTLASFPESHNR